MRDLKIPEQRHPEKARRPDNAQPKKPDWIRVRAPGGKGYEDTARIMRENKISCLPVVEEGKLVGIITEHDRSYTTILLPSSD